MKPENHPTASTTRHLRRVGLAMSAMLVTTGLLLAPLKTAQAQTQTAANTPLKVGLMLPYTGTYASLGNPIPPKPPTTSTNWSNATMWMC